MASNPNNVNSNAVSIADKQPEQQQQQQRRESSQPKLISAETVSKNMQPNIHMQFNSLKTTTAATAMTPNGVAGAYAPIQQQQYFNRNWTAATTATTATASYLSPASTSTTNNTSSSITTASSYLAPAHLASSTPKPCASHLIPADWRNPGLNHHQKLHLPYHNLPYMPYHPNSGYNNFNGSGRFFKINTLII